MHKSQRRILVVLLVACGLAVFVLLSKTLRDEMDGTPYRMVIEPEDGGAVVRFVRPDEKLESPPFRVAVEVDGPQEIVLDRELKQVPVGKVEFSDTTLLPGRFTIQLGESVLDVMPARINVDGKDYSWQPRTQPAPASTP